MSAQNESNCALDDQLPNLGNWLTPPTNVESNEYKQYMSENPQNIKDNSRNINENGKLPAQPFSVLLPTQNSKCSIPWPHKTDRQEHLVCLFL